jgi:hypothetical protein
MIFPINSYDISQLPTSEHPGAFGTIRKHHRHEGIDLYAGKNALVQAISSGVIVALYQFTGEAVGMPWWEDTWAMAVQDDTGIWVYGEIQRPVTRAVGDVVVEGQYIAQLKRVLKTDKGRPMDMLHLERWKKYSAPHTMLWQVDQSQPDFLLDPTPLLQEIQHDART